MRNHKKYIYKYTRAGTALTATCLALKWYFSKLDALFSSCDSYRVPVDEQQHGHEELPHQQHQHQAQVLWQEDR